MMKKIQWILGIVASLSLIIVLLITSFEIAVYGDYSFYEEKYRKYNVQANIDMEMEDIMAVTREMVPYLRGNREDLVVMTTVAGESREFFNDREKAHMYDVQQLFIKGLQLRIICIIVIVLCVAGLLMTKADWKRLLPLTYQIGTAIFVVITGSLLFLFSRDFTKYFIIFHEIFFSNDLWILNPETDLMINILPEGFFMDMGIRIIVIFIVFMVASLLVSIGFDKGFKRRKEN
jgi:integral membrane protein TIGR01906